VPLWDYLPADTRWFIDEPEGLIGAAAEELQEYVEQHARRRAARDLVAPPEAVLRRDEEIAAKLQAAPVVGSRLAIADAGRGR
jgi:transcription-repair coupling factor (superfamily II helicase)